MFKASCVFTTQLVGYILFLQKDLDAPVFLSGEIHGLSPGKHGIHVHEFGDLRNGCVSAGGHFNPFNNKHGAPFDSERHVGDLGNIESDYFKYASVELLDDEIELVGDNSIIGRAIVVHSEEDDLGRGGNKESLKTGNAGQRVDCCVIGLGEKPKFGQESKNKFQRPHNVQLNRPQGSFGGPHEMYHGQQNRPQNGQQSYHRQQESSHTQQESYHRQQESSHTRQESHQSQQNSFHRQESRIRPQGRGGGGPQQMYEEEPDINEPIDKFQYNSYGNYPMQRRSDPQPRMQQRRIEPQPLIPPLQQRRFDGPPPINSG